MLREFGDDELRTVWNVLMGKMVLSCGTLARVKEAPAAPSNKRTPLDWRGINLAGDPNVWWAASNNERAKETVTVFILMICKYLETAPVFRGESGDMDGTELCLE